MRFVPFCLGTVSLLCIPIAAQTALTFPEYEKQLSEQLSRDQMFREQIAQEQALIIDYKVKIKESQGRLEALRQKKYSLLGATASDVDLAAAKLTSCKNEARELSALSNAELLSQQDRITLLHTEIDAVSSSAAIALPKLWKTLKVLRLQTDSLDERLTACWEEEKKRTTAPAVPVEKKSTAASYTVSKITGKPETLNSIAAKVYGDRSRWPEIYRANKEMLNRNFEGFNHTGKKTGIVNPSDLILPGQILIIPR